MPNEQILSYIMKRTGYILVDEVNDDVCLVLDQQRLVGLESGVMSQNETTCRLANCCFSCELVL
jgi:hypothetical protein